MPNRFVRIIDGREVWPDDIDEVMEITKIINMTNETLDNLEKLRRTQDGETSI